MEKAIEPKSDKHGQTLRKRASHGARWYELVLVGRCEHSDCEMRSTQTLRYTATVMTPICHKDNTP